MVNGVHAVQGAPDGVGVAHVADQEFDFGHPSTQVVLRSGPCTWGERLSSARTRYPC